MSTSASSWHGRAVENAMNLRMAESDDGDGAVCLRLIVREGGEVLGLLGEDLVAPGAGHHFGCCLEPVSTVLHAHEGMGEKVVVPIGIRGCTSLGGKDEQRPVVGDLADQ